MQLLPDQFKNMTDVEANEAIRQVKHQWDSDLLILGHHYQSDAVIALSDQRGDSLELARCPNMYKTSVQDIAWVLSRPGEINLITVPEEIRNPASKALKRMLDLSVKTP